MLLTFCFILAIATRHLNMLSSEAIKDMTHADCILQLLLVSTYYAYVCIVTDSL